MIRVGSYRFMRQRALGEKTRWGCHYARFGCRAAFYTTGDQIVKVSGEHNHDMGQKPIKVNRSNVGKRINSKQDK